MNLVEETKIVKISAPKSYASTAATTEYVNMGLYADVDFIIETGAWAGGTAAVTVKEAVNASGSSAAAMAVTAMWSTETAVGSASVDNDTWAKNTVASSTFNLDTASAQYLVHVDNESLTDGKDYVAIQVASPGANADYYSITAILSNPRYTDDNPPSAIA